MKRLTLIFIFFWFGASVALAQQNYSIAGTVDFCYENDHQIKASKANVLMVLRAETTEKEYKTTTDAHGNYSFGQIPEGNYRLSAVALGFPENDTTLALNSDVKQLRFCIDKVFRPAPEDSVATYRQMALEDIRTGNARIYEFTALSLIGHPFKKLNPKVKKKYGFVYEQISCARPTTRKEIVQLKLWETYNQVVYQHLEEKHGAAWRETIKHERLKLK